MNHVFIYSILKPAGDEDEQMKEISSSGLILLALLLCVVDQLVKDLKSNRENEQV